MPHKPKRPCSHPGCSRLTNSRFCEEHAKQETQRCERYQRDPTVKKRYGRAWKRVRDRFIASHLLCQRCKEHSKITPAQEVHHIVPLSQGGTHEETNLMALCTSCHSEITAREGGRWGKSMHNSTPSSGKASHMAASRPRWLGAAGRIGTSCRSSDMAMIQFP